jgi:predicted RNase H-like nuclease (RuvC/YqgF family)
MLTENITKLKQQQSDFMKKIEEKSATIADLERQLSMSKDSVNVIMQLEKKVKT